MYFSLLSSCLVPLRLRYLPQHPIFELHLPVFLPKCKIRSSAHIKKQNAKF